jgi:hypothetical protein
MRDAMRDVTNPSDHLTIVQTGTLVIITGADGRATRLSPDGKKSRATTPVSSGRQGGTPANS